MPFASRSSSRLSPSMPSKQKFTLPGRRGLSAPLSAQCGILRSPSISRSRSAETFFAFSSRWSQASFNAAAMPTMPGTFSVPALLPRSCAPPSMILVRIIPRRAYSAPTPLGPWNLCPDIESISMCIAFTSIATCPAACTASVWNRTPAAWQTAPISAMGWMVPISLLANMIVTRHVSSRMASLTCCAVTRPFSCTSSSVTSKPSFSSFASVCSTA